MTKKFRAFKHECIKTLLPTQYIIEFSFKFDTKVSKIIFVFITTFLSTFKMKIFHKIGKKYKGVEYLNINVSKLCFQPNTP